MVNDRDDKFEDKIENEDIFDQLTGIYNRKGFYIVTEKLLHQYPEKQFCLLYWNIRKFKVINNLFGRTMGDQVLINFANLLKSKLDGKLATYARCERDNFLCCMPENALDLEEWKKLCSINYQVDDLEYQYFTCFGIFRVKDIWGTVGNMVDKARIAMETVKENYVTPYAWFEERMWGDIVLEQELNSDFQRAIKEKQFKVYYQPVCSTTDGKIIGAEALVRWQHPQKGLIPPGTFIPLYEKNGFINVLDRYMWDAVCAMQRKRLDEGKLVVPVSFNVSRVEFYNPSLCDDIFHIVNKYNLPENMIRIEITESAYSNDPQLVLDAAHKLHEYGFVVLMDDFGSGYSSLNTLKDLPIDILKIDMKFLDDFEVSKKGAIILEAVMRMAKWMKLKTVAEGVETRKEWDYLKSVECDSVQGYYFYKPMPAADFFELLDGDKVGSTKETRLDDKVLDIFSHGNSRESIIFYSMLGGMGVLEIKGENIELIQANEGYYEVLYGSDYLKKEKTEEHSIFSTEPERSILMEKCIASEKNSSVEQAQLCYQRADDEYVWLNIKLRYMGKYAQRSLFLFTIDNIDKIKKMEQESYLLHYSAALIKIFDKVYRLDYDTGMAEVLHTRGLDKMKEQEKYYFPDFFERFADSLDDGEYQKISTIIRDKDMLDKKLQESEDSNFSFSYEVHSDNTPVKKVFAMFFKITLEEEKKEEYLCCIKVTS